ncbi:MAG: hypothetical protein QXT73_07605 [Candidatus Methanomethylicaceae archaeon]
MVYLKISDPLNNIVLNKAVRSAIVIQMSHYLSKAKNFIIRIVSLTYRTYCTYTPSSIYCFFQWIAAKFQLRALSRVDQDGETEDEKPSES